MKPRATPLALVLPNPGIPGTRLCTNVVADTVAGVPANPSSGASAAAKGQGTVDRHGCPVDPAAKPSGSPVGRTPVLWQLVMATA